MAELAVVDDRHYQRQLQALCAERAEPAFLSTLREAGMARFEQLGLPTRRQESWRFTDMSGFAAIAFERASPAPVAADQIPAPFETDPATRGPRLVFINGRFNAALSRQIELPDGVLVGSLAQAQSEHGALLEQYLGHSPDLADNAFSALNDALFEDGALIYIPRGKQLEQPIELVFWSASQSGAAPVAVYPRNLILLEAGAQATVVESYHGASDAAEAGSCFCCPQSECVLAQDAILHYHKLQQEGPATYHLGALRLQLAAGSQADLHLLSASGKLNRTDIHARLDGPGADCSIDGLTLLQDGELGDYHLCVEHAQPLGNSRQSFKSVLDGKSRAVFDGLIKVVKDAQKTDASQTCRNLLLSKRAVANANPRLEILADDVKCAHGSTVGYLDPDALFYLRARGINEAEARAMLVYSFANEQIERIKLVPLRERLERLLHTRFYPEGKSS